MLQEIITAIDIGSKKLSATIGVKNKSNELEIFLTKSCKSVGIEKGTIVDINKCREAIEKLLKELGFNSYCTFKNKKIEYRDLDI